VSRAFLDCRPNVTKPAARLPRFRWIAICLLAFLVPNLATAAEIPTYLPKYDLDINLEVDNHVAHVRQRVAWTNRHQRPTKELRFNVHSKYYVPDDQIGFMAKMLEIMRMMPSEALITGAPAINIDKVTLFDLPQAGIDKPAEGLELPAIRGQKPEGQDDALPPPRAVPVPPAVLKDLQFHWDKEINTTLVVPLPREVGCGETITVEIAFTFNLPQKQGRWGQWKGVTYLTNWLPVLSFYDEKGWQPVPFIPWHQPWFNEAGVYNVRVTLPCNQVVGSTGSVVNEKDLGNGLKQLDIFCPAARDFALLASARYKEFCDEACGVKLKVLAFPEHEHYAKVILRVIGEAIPVYSQWFGPYPYPEFTIAESYFGWNGNECSGLVMIDERVFAMPHLAENYVDYLVSHETCHQWWYNVVGTNGYCETFMDEAPANYFSHKLEDGKHGKNNPMLKYPRCLEWLPSIDRENYRYYGLYGTLGRGEAGPCVQPMEKFGHVVNLFSLAYDRGSKVMGMIEARLGEPAFIDFMRTVNRKYYFRILRVQDYQRELEAYTGQSWEEFFQRWVHDKGTTDWCLEKVKFHEEDEPLCSRAAALLSRDKGPCHVTVLLHQKCEYNEPTVLGFCMEDSTCCQVRVPIYPNVPHLELEDPPAIVDVVSENRVRVKVTLPRKPTQICIDPDKVLLDSNPTNNCWRPPIKWRLTPLYTFLDETDLTTDYDRFNVITGPWIYFPAYDDPWFTRSLMAGVRAGLYRTQTFNGGLYAAYRSDFNDFVAGADAMWDHWPWAHTQVGFVAEHRLRTLFGGNQNANRGVLYGRYVIDYGSSLYLPPMQYVEAYGTYQDNFLPHAKTAPIGAERYTSMSVGGLHYHINYLTPYWDPEGGFQLDVTYGGGETKLEDKHRPYHQVIGQFSAVKCLPEWLGCLSETRLAVHAYGAAATPRQGEFFPLGGETRFRGFNLPDRIGSLIWGGSLEWRIPIVRDVQWDWCDHVLGFRNIYAAAFYDVGDAYANGRSFGPVAHALGGGLRADVAWFSFIERTILRMDIAKTVNTNTPVQVYIGVQHPF